MLEASGEPPGSPSAGCDVPVPGLPAEPGGWLVKDQAERVDETKMSYVYP
jgi:hypothetical protein